MWAEKLSKQWTPCITTSLRLWDQFLLEHIVHRLNIEGFTRHNKQYIIEGTSEDRWVTPVEWRCDMLWRGGAVTVTEGDAQATLWLQSLTLWLYPWRPTWPTAKSYFRSCQFQTAPIQTSGGTVSQNSHPAEQQLLENHTRNHTKFLVCLCKLGK